MRALCVVFSVLLVSAVAVRAQSPSSFVTLTPCRVVDTRDANGPLGGPAIAAQTYRTFLLPSSACNVPSLALAYSLNITVIPSGVGVGYLAIWPAGQPQPVVSTLNDESSGPLANAAIVPAGANGGINVFVTDTADVIIDINGYFVAQTNSTSTALGAGASNAGTQNTAVGYNTLQANSGSLNTAVGSYALAANSTGANNTALGASALLSNALGSANTALGTDALLNSLVGNDNTAVGFAALNSNTTGSANLAVGASALWNLATGGNNVAIGTNALYGNTTGSWNIAVGYQAGNNITTGNYNIDVGNSANASDSGVIRIGDPASQSSAYIAGITSTSISGVPVLINGNGQLGVQTSSARFKEDIQNIQDVSQALARLRPVMFHYRSPDPDGSKRLHYGLIAEEVDKVYPELVFRDSEDKPFAVEYQELPVLLLKEIQQQRATIAEQQQKMAAEERELMELSARLQALEQSLKQPAKPSPLRSPASQ